MKKPKQSIRKIENNSPQAKEPVKPTKKKIGKDTTVYPASLGHHGTDKEERLNAEE